MASPRSSSSSSSQADTSWSNPGTFPPSDSHFDVTMHADEPFAFDHLFSHASYAPIPVPPPFEEFRAEDFKFKHEDFLGLNNSNSADAFAALDAFFSPEYVEPFALTQPVPEDEEPLLNQLEQRFFSEFLDNLVLDQNYSFDPQGLPPNLPVLPSLSATAHNAASVAGISSQSRMVDSTMELAGVAERKRKVGMDLRIRSSTNGGMMDFFGSGSYYGIRETDMSSPSNNGHGFAGAGLTSPSHNIVYPEGAPISPSPPYSPSFPNAVPAKRKSEQWLNSQGYARRRSNAGVPHVTHHMESRDVVGTDSDGNPSSSATGNLPRRLSFSSVTSNLNGLSVESMPFTPYATAVSIICKNGSTILPHPGHRDGPEHDIDGTEIQQNHNNNHNHIDDGDKNHTNLQNSNPHTLPVTSSPTSVHLPPITVPPHAICKHPPTNAECGSYGVPSEPQTPATANGPTSATKGKKEKEKKPPKELLTEEEKRANHIASEQKRRNTIRAGFKEMTEIVPRLRDVNNSKSTILFKAVDFIHHLRQRNSTLRNIASDLEVQLKLASAASVSGGQHRQQPIAHHVDNSHLSHSHSHSHPKTSSHLLHSQLYTNNLYGPHRHTLMSTSQQSPISPTPNSL